MSYLDFVKKKELVNESSQFVLEAFKEKDYRKARNTIDSILRKEITSGHLAYYGSYVFTFNKKDTCVSELYTVDKKGSYIGGFSINFLMSGQSMVPYSVSFFNGENAHKLLWGSDEVTVTTKASLVIDMMGASIVYYIPIIANVMNSGKFDITSDEAVKQGRKVFNTKNECVEWPLYFGAQKYTIFEGMDPDKVRENFHLAFGHKYVKIGENYGWTIAEGELDDKKKEVYAKMKSAAASGDHDAELVLYKEYRKILNAIKGGATSMDDLKCNVTRNVSVTNTIEGGAKAQQQIERHKSDPKTAFKEMQMYVKMVIKGIQPAVILCGAPGIGKTYRIMQQLKAAGYTMTGDNVIKGKCSPRQLYLTLYNNKGKGDIVVIDDADGLVGPKAPEECINILKAALDSTADDEGRLVSYKITGDLKDDEGTPVPKSCYVKCGVIVITNYCVGQLDSALRNRAFTQSLDFDVKDVLQIVKDLMPNIEPNHLSMTSKAKAMDYLQKLVEDGKPVEVSIRSFITCSRCFENAESDEELELAQHMIEEQMRNMSLTKKDSKHF